MRWAVVVLVAVGCGDNVAMPVGIVQGTRLAANGYAFAGASLFTGWHDTAIGIDCSFDVDADGTFRCLPQARSYSYADATCTQPTVAVEACDPVPRYATGERRLLAACPTDYGEPVLEVGERTADQAYFYRDGTSCRQGTNGTNAVFYAAHDVAAATFVAAELVREPGPGSIVPYALHATDGSREIRSTWNLERDEECNAYQRDGRCRPWEIALHETTLWADSSCSSQAAVDLVRGAPCAKPTATIAYDADLNPSFREIGVRITTPVFASDDDGVCTPAQLGTTGDVYYREGELIPDAAFPIETRVLDGTGELQAVRYEQTPGAPLRFAYEIYNTARAEACSVIEAVDGEARCVPAYEAAPAAHGAGLYADAECTAPVATITDAAKVLLLEHDPAPGTCGTTSYEARAIGDTYTGMLWTGTECARTPPSSSEHYALIGAAIELPAVARF